MKLSMLIDIINVCIESRYGIKCKQINKIHLCNPL